MNASASVFATIVIATLFGFATPASASCEDKAAICVSNGESKAICYGKERMANCRKTGYYVGTSGRRYPAN
jgi:hypothetical protein